MDEEHKYLANGQEVYVVKVLSEGFLVENMYRGNDEDEWSASPTYFTEKVFDQAPTMKEDAKLAKLKAEIRDLYETRKGLIQEIETVKKTEAERFKKYERYKALKRLDDFLEGKITHYAFCDYYSWKIQSVEDQLKGGDKDYRTGKHLTKLLTLMGRSNGDLEWNLNHYSDGSGGKNTVIPCCSYEEAVEIIRKDLQAKTEIDEHSLASAEKYGIELNPEVVAAYKEKQRNRLGNEVETRRKELDKAIEELTKFDISTEAT